MFAITIDQRRSRQSADQVPQLLADLSGRALVREFERTAGDEIQGLCADPAETVDIAVAVARDQQWWIGIGIGDVDQPLPPSVRASRGPALIAARHAVERAHRSPVGLAVDPEGVEYAETALLLLTRLIVDQTPEGREAVEAMAVHPTQKAAARTLGISTQAMSGRLQVARWTDVHRARELSIHLLDQVARHTPDAVAP